MPNLKDLPCWEIMKCQESSRCMARQDMSHACWELARDLNHLQNVLDICRDCIVYLIKGDTAKFDEEELADIWAHRKLDGYNHKCMSITVDLAQPDYERRRGCPL